jgi:hypothetical protein
VAHGVVHHLEVVQLGDDDGGDPALTGRPLDRLLGGRDEDLAVGQAGERVAGGLPVELVLHPPALGHVAQGDHEAGDRRLRPQVAAGRLDQGGAVAVPLDPPRLAGVVGLSRPDPGEPPLDLVRALAFDQVGQRGPGQVGGVEERGG